MKDGVNSGEKEVDFDQVRFTKAKNWIKGAVKAIREYDTNVKIILPGEGNNFAVLDSLQRDKVDFDEINWKIQEVCLNEL